MYGPIAVYTASREAWSKKNFGIPAKGVKYATG